MNDIDDHAAKSNEAEKAVATLIKAGDAP